MLQLHGKKGARTRDDVSRRDFLKAGSLGAGAMGLTLADLHARGAGRDVNCILLFLVGGPSQLDTWDLKPSAPSTVRGPFRPIRTNVPGVDISEHFPRMATMADRFAVVRSVHHAAAPIHETGHQLMQTGRLFQGGQEHPHYGAVLSHQRGSRGGLPPFVVLPGPLGSTGVSVSHGQGAAYLGASHEPFMAEPVAPRHTRRDELCEAIDDAHRAFDADPTDGPARQAAQAVFSPAAKAAFDISSERPDLRARYGRNTFGQSCLTARRLVEAGVRLVTVNMFDTVFNRVTWDCHADGGSLPATLDDYRTTLCPTFDQAYSALLDDLHARGLLANTLVVATGEFGRTPHLNARGGRDHWPGVWSMLFAGAGVRGGQVVGASDRLGAEPRQRPVTPAEVAATVYHALGVDLSTRLPGPDGRPVPLVDAAPVRELF